MADQNWTPSLVEERLVEAADVLKRLPDETRQGYFSTWPAVLLEFSDLAICWKVGLQRAAAHQHWLYGLCVLAWKLNGRHVPSRRSKRFIIDMVRGSKSVTV